MDGVLVGATFESGTSIGDTPFNRADLTGADFTGARIRDTTFDGSNLTVDQLAATASYANRDLFDVQLRDLSLPGIDLSGFWVDALAGSDLTNARLSDVRNGVGALGLIDTDLTRADLRGADYAPDTVALAADLSGTISPTGFIAGGVTVPTAQTWTIFDYDGGIPITVGDHMTVEPGATVRILLEDLGWGSTISFGPASTVDLAGTLLLDIDAEDLSPFIGETFRLFDWTGPAIVGAFDAIVGARDTVWDVSDLYTTGEATLVAVVPAPGVVATLLIAACPAAARRPRPA